jgi:hypothetical protein
LAPRPDERRTWLPPAGIISIALHIMGAKCLPGCLQVGHH